MSEAIAGLALAASILQVLDHGRQFVTTAWKLYESGGDAVQSTTVLQRLSKNLDSTLRSAQKNPSTVSPEIDEEMAILAIESRTVSVKIQGMLSRVNLTEDASRSKRKALRAAFNIFWNRDEIKSLEVELDGINKRLILALLASLRSSRNPQDSKDSIADQEFESLNIGAEVVSYVSRMAGRSDPGELTKSIGKEIHSVEYDNDQVIPNLGTSRIGGRDQRLLQAEFLKSLYYDGMYDRETSIAPAHAKTFQWIFENDTERRIHWKDFRQWLESDNQLYWITGKAGSGKSTLMKFISAPHSRQMPRTVGVNTMDPPTTSELRCTDYLQKWSGDEALLVGSFYFWAAGSQVQTSTQGLFRTLLHQLLAPNERIIQKVAPIKWEQLLQSNRNTLEFTVHELQDLLSRTIDHLSSRRICLFVDGLDEFKGHHHNECG